MMTQTESVGYEGVLNIVSQWPLAQRRALVQDVLETITTGADEAKPLRRTLQQALGLLATDQPPPSDTEVARWLDEHHTEKYG